jgi:hypothetical protein
MNTHADETRRIVDRIDETRRSEYFRNPDRPGSVHRAPPRDPAIIRAQSRLRVAAWRNRMDERRAPTSAQIGAALVDALATAGNLDKLTVDDDGLVGHALFLLQRKGFDIIETKETLKRVRSRLLDSETVENGASGPRRR